MHLTTTSAVLVGLLPLLSLATPFALPQVGRNSGSNQCDASTFNNGKDLSIDPAPVTDCKSLISNIDRAGTFSISHSWARPYTYGQCAFSVRVILGGRPGLIGGADVVDLTQDSITKFQETGFVSCKGEYGQIVGAEGEVNCNDNTGTGEQVRVQWILASSGYNPQNFS